MRIPKNALAAAAILSACVLFVLPLATAEDAAAQARDQMLNDGSVSYNRYCESCHGAQGHGDGPVAQYLTIEPADLTRISARRDGEFPAGEIQEIIDGRKGVRGHGSDMPIWGDAFQRTEETEDEEVIRRKITALVYFLETMQEKTE